MKKLFILLCILFFVFFVYVVVNKEPTQLKVGVENIQVDKKSSYVWGLTASVRNYEQRKIKGFVKIKFKNKTGDIVYTANAMVNHMDFIDPLQAATFKHYTLPKNFKGVVNFQVIFTER